MTLPPIPKSKDLQMKQLELAVCELTYFIMDIKNWDNRYDVADRLSDEINLIVQRAYKRNDK